MTLKFSESPAVQIKEIDLTGTVPSVTSTTGAIVGDFNWGPVNTPVLVGNESELAAVFGTPNMGDAYSGDFLSASYFLKYSSSLYVVRAGSDGQAYASFSLFTAKNPGKLGDNILVSVAGGAEFSGWDYESEFSSAPNDSENEIHVIVVDSSTTPYTVLEQFEFLSVEQGARLENGSNNFVLDVINSQSSWVTVATVDFDDGAGNIDSAPILGEYQLVGGDSNGQLTQGEYTTGYDAFENKENIQIDFLIAPAGAQFNAPNIHKYLNSIAVQRKDCVAVASVKYQDLLNDSLSAGIGSYVSALSENSSYLIVDGNHIKVYNKYEDKYEWIPAASSTAGVMAATDAVSAPWFSPAGSRRGQYLGVTEILVNPSKTERDVMYKAGINPIISMPGQGIMLFGDKTHLSRPSAFDRINVRRLFLVIERAISRAGENVMFEFNDEFTRAEFVNIVEPFLREIQGRRGITDFRVVCDDTNNTPEVVDRNEFIASCFIKPARSINYVTLNFVAVRTGVEFEEVVGTV